MEEIDFMAEYLAKELADVKMYNIQEVKNKIKASLIILLDESVKTDVTERLKKKVNTHIYVTKRKEVELKFWKDKIREKIKDVSEINSMYSEIDNLLVEMDLKKQ